MVLDFAQEMVQATFQVIRVPAVPPPRFDRAKLDSSHEPSFLDGNLLLCLSGIQFHQDLEACLRIPTVLDITLLSLLPGIFGRKGVILFGLMKFGTDK